MLKSYQERTQAKFRAFTEALTEGQTAEKVWDELRREKRIPVVSYQTGKGREKKDVREFPKYNPLHDVRPETPFLCLKIPTGGGKTLMAGTCIESVQLDLLKRRTGMVLWVVPSDAIYTQTMKDLRSRSSMLRQVFERASGGRVKVLEFRRSKRGGLRITPFSPYDLETKLCVLVTTRQAFHLKGNESDEVKRKFFDQNGEFCGFFPDQGDQFANQDLMNRIPELDSLGSDAAVWARAPKMSLANVLRIVEPVVVVDEAHIAATPEFRSNVASLRPTFVLELTATPEPLQHNLLVDVTGTELHDEEMIKLPINLSVAQAGDWTQVVRDVWAKLQQLDAAAWMPEAMRGGRIRPIGVLRVSATGKNQKGKGKLHADDVKSYLVDVLGIPEVAVRIKSAEVDEIGSDDLMNPESPVRFVITKDALREGWDCPFAYVLGVLSPTGSETALTQMIGRVLRQPYARRSASEVLNQCYVFTMPGETEKLAKAIKKGLESVGLKDVTGAVKTGDEEEDEEDVRKPVARKDAKPKQALLPILLDGRLSQGEHMRHISYEEHVIGKIDWFDLVEGIDLDDFVSSAEDASKNTRMTIGLNTSSYDDEEDVAAAALDHVFLARQLIDIIPHPWAAMDLVRRVVEALKDDRWSDIKISRHAGSILIAIRDLVKAATESAAQNVFNRGLDSGDLVVGLQKVTIDELVADMEVVGNPDDIDAWQRCLVEDFDLGTLNSLEKKAANKLDGSPVVEYWAKLGDRSKLGIQGWRKHQVNPDFVVVSRHTSPQDTIAYRMIETKGRHLEANKDSGYKNTLFKILNRALSKRNDEGITRLIYVRQDHLAKDIDAAVNTTLIA